MSEVENDGIEEMRENVEALKDVANTTEEANELGNEEDVVEYTVSESKAMEMGWNPNKDDMPEGKEWISAGEFIRNDKLFSEIRKLKREGQANKRDFEVLKEHHKKVEVATRDKLLAQLKYQKKTAMEEDDHDTVIEIDEQIMEIKAHANEETAVEAQTNDNTAFLSWVEDNQWYETDTDMRQTAEEIGAAYYNRTGGKASQDDLLKYVEGRVKQLFPDAFESKQPVKTKAAPTVEAAGANRARPSSKSKFTAKDLNADQRAVMNRFVKQGVLKESEYIAELVAIGELS